MMRFIAKGVALIENFFAHIRIDPETQKKTFQTVQAHCDACAGYAGAALAGIGLEHTGKLCGKMHDGKMTRAYQKYLIDSASGVSVRRGAVNHTFAPVRYLLERYHAEGADRKRRPILLSIGAHVCRP